MTINWTDLFLILALVGAGCTVIFLLLLRKTRQLINDRHLRIADQLVALDDAIRAIETRLAERHAPELTPAKHSMADSTAQDQQRAEESETVATDIQAVIAASAVAALGRDIHIRSMKPATSSWSQQGRVVVQGSHNARARR